MMGGELILRIDFHIHHTIINEIDKHNTLSIKLKKYPITFFLKRP
jgi:hypothetical protein